MTRFLTRIAATLNLIFWCAVSSVAAVLYIMGVCFLGIVEEWSDDRAPDS